MKFVVRNGPGTVQMNFMWLPTFIGMNGALVRELEQHLSPVMLGKELTEELLETASQAAVDYLVKKFPHVRGLSDYLDGLKFIEENGSEQAEEKGRPPSPSPG